MKDCSSSLGARINIRHTQEDTLLHESWFGVAYFRPSTKLRCIAESGAGNLHVPRRLRNSAAHPQYTREYLNGPAGPLPPPPFQVTSTVKNLHGEHALSYCHLILVEAKTTGIHAYFFISFFFFILFYTIFFHFCRKERNNKINLSDSHIHFYFRLEFQIPILDEVIYIETGFSLKKREKKNSNLQKC